MKGKDRWVPLRRAGLLPTSEEHIRLSMQRTGLDCPAGFFPIDIEMIHLNIRRRDGRVIFRDWRHFQRIKNQLVGEEAEAVEIYPAESRLSDTSNKYHLWCFPAGYKLPFGIDHGRDVIDVGAPGVPEKPGFRQRKL